MTRSRHKFAHAALIAASLFVLLSASACPEETGSSVTDTSTGSVADGVVGNGNADGGATTDTPAPYDSGLAETTDHGTSDAASSDDAATVSDEGGVEDTSSSSDATPQTDATNDDAGTVSDANASDTLPIEDGTDTTASTDAAPPDADVPTANDDTVGDSAAADAAPDVPPTPTCDATVTITGPEPSTFHVAAEGATFTATVTADVPVETLKVMWTLPDGTVVGESDVGADGTTTWISGALPIGIIDITATPHDATGACTGTAASHPARMCKVHVVENFDTALDPSTWQVNGDAYWDSGGWLELTGASMNRVGQIINTVEYVVEGQAQLTVDLATGGGSNPGADGFAVTILEAQSAVTVNEIMANASTGGGLGYGVAGEYGAWDGDALTIEVDTWHNQYNGTTQKHTDPTPEDHLEITLGADPGNSLAHAELTDIEDLSWRTVQVRILLGKVEVRVNGELRIDVPTPQDFSFRGGYIIFSGSTGYYTNFHRVDNLDIIHDCKTAP